jgi:hypothetical protein
MSETVILLSTPRRKRNIIILSKSIALLILRIFLLLRKSVSIAEILRINFSGILILERFFPTIHKEMKIKKTSLTKIPKCEKKEEIYRNTTEKDKERLKKVFSLLPILLRLPVSTSNSLPIKYPRYSHEANHINPPSERFVRTSLELK